MLHMNFFIDRLHDALDYASNATRHASRLAYDTDLGSKPHNEKLLFDYIKMLNDAVKDINEYTIIYKKTTKED